MNNVLISGLPPSAETGVGRLMQTLEPLALKKGYRVLSRPERPHVKKLLRKGQVLLLILSLLRWPWAVLSFYFRLRKIAGAHVLVLHPQTLGWRSFFQLSDVNEVSLFLVDNSYFCIRSYNHLPGTYGECLRCLEGFEHCHPDCRPFPVPYSRQENFAYLERFKQIAPNLSFWFQNRRQKELLEKYVGLNVGGEVVGLTLDEFHAKLDEDARFAHEGFYEEVVFHGAPQEAKGVLYALELARALDPVRFTFPFERKRLLKLAPGLMIPENVNFVPMTWENGLREKVINAKVVLCPSQWSAPIEGALVKSLLFNGNVAIYETKYGYAGELPDWLITKLGSNMGAASRDIRKMFDVDIEARMRVRAWMKNHLENEVSLEKIFSHMGTSKPIESN